MAVCNCPTFTASVVLWPSCTPVIFWPPASKPWADTLPVNTGASANWISMVPLLATVRILELEDEPEVKPPEIVVFSPNWRLKSPVLPAKSKPLLILPELAVNSCFKSKIWPPFTASFEPEAMLPSATLVILLPPLFRPVLVKLTGFAPPIGVIVIPVPFNTVLLPAASVVVTVVNATSSFVAMLTWLAVWVTLIFFPASTVTVSPFWILSSVTVPPNSPSLAVAAKVKPAAFNWATFTASVSCVPAATLVIWRVTVVPLPTETAAWLAFQVEVVLSVAAFSGSAPVWPKVTSATLPEPNATPLATVALASRPKASELLAEALALEPKAVAW